MYNNRYIPSHLFLCNYIGVIDPMFHICSNVLSFIISFNIPLSFSLPTFPRNAICVEMGKLSGYPTWEVFEISCSIFKYPYDTDQTQICSHGTKLI